MFTVIMPQVGQDIPAGKIVQWIKAEGEPVEVGEVVLVVESEKASFEIEAERAGIVLKILHDEGEEVEILKPLAFIGEPGESVDQIPADTAGPKSASDITSAKPGKPAQTDKPPVPNRPAASPAARRLATEHAIDLTDVTGTGPGGRITAKDVETHIQPAQAVKQAAPAGGAPGDVVVPFGKMRKRIADRLTMSKRTIPHFYLMIDVDMTDALAWRKNYNAEGDTHITVTDLVVKAAASALGKFSRLNGHVTDASLVTKADINIGLAVAVEAGLLVPVIANTDKLSLTEISAAADKIADDARRGMVKPEPVGTFTVTSLGMHNVGQFVPIINPPECAILAVGSAKPRPAVIGDAVVVRNMMTLTLACDHRAVDGAEAAGLLNEIKRNLEEVATSAN